MLDDAMRRLLDFDHRRYWLVNGWSIRFRVGEIEASAVWPYGIKYSFTLHDHNGRGLLGFDNAHGYRVRRPSITGTASGARRRPLRTNSGVPTN
jgi:hypothetical protein